MMHDSDMWLDSWDIDIFYTECNYKSEDIFFIFYENFLIYKNKNNLLLFML